MDDDAQESALSSRNGGVLGRARRNERLAGLYLRIPIVHLTQPASAMFHLSPQRCMRKAMVLVPAQFLRGYPVWQILPLHAIPNIHDGAVIRSRCGGLGDSEEDGRYSGFGAALGTAVLIGSYLASYLLGIEPEERRQPCKLASRR